MNIEIDWTPRQPKDAPWCWPAREFYPCGCGQDDWDSDDYCESHPWRCRVCAPVATYKEERERKAVALRSLPSERHQMYEKWLRDNGWIGGGALARLGELLKQFYLPALVESLNQPMLITGLLP